MKKLFLLIIIILLSVYIVACTAMGTNPDGIYLDNIHKSEQFNTSLKKFQNPEATPLLTGKRSYFDVLSDFFFKGENRRPSEKLPEDASSLEALASKANNIRFIWFGHSTILLEMDKKRILIDPVFSKYASPIPGIVKRFQPPVYDVKNIHDVDVVLISHDHNDHLDYETIKKLKKRNLKFIVPLGVGAHLRYWGVDEKKITELDWWENVSIQGLIFTAAPAQHFAGRGLFNENSTLWASWVVQGKERNIYFGGDSGYSKHYKEIGDRLGPFDLTFLENGAYDLSWKFVHQLPEEGVQANIDLRGKAMVPIHWGMFDLALHSWHEPVERVTKEAEIKGVKIIAPKLGQLVSIQSEYKQETWWDSLIKAGNRK